MVLDGSGLEIGCFDALGFNALCFTIQEENENKILQKERDDCQRKEMLLSNVKETWRKQLEEKKLESIRVQKEIADHVEQVLQSVISIGCRC